MFLSGVTSVGRTVRITRHVGAILRGPVRMSNGVVFASTDVNVLVKDAGCAGDGSVFQSISVTLCQTGRLNHGHCRVFKLRVCRRTVTLLGLRGSLQTTVRRRSFITCCRPVVSLQGRALVNFRTLTH